MASWDFVKSKINDACKQVKNIVETIKDNPILDQTTKILIAQIPVVGPFILDCYNSVGGKDEDKTKDVLKFLENLQQKDEEYFNKLSNGLEKNYDAIIKNREVLTKIISEGFDEVLGGQKEIKSRLDDMDEKLNSVLNSVNNTFGIIDKVSSQMTSFVRNEPESTTPHRVIAVKKGNEIQFQSKLDPNFTPTLTIDDLKKLDENSRLLIIAYEKSMQQQFELWTIIYPQKDASVDPVVNAKVKQQLTEITKSMCGDLTKIINYLESIGVPLIDHYGHIYQICNEL